MTRASIGRCTFGALLLSVVSLTALPSPAVAQTGNATGRFVDHIYRDADGEHKYVVFEPAGYDASKKWPLVFYLHGASGRGRDGRAQLVVGLGPAVKARAATFPFLVVFPQNENLKSRLLGGWNDGSPELPRAMRILEEVENTYSVNRDHEVLVGVSMGAFGTWQVAAESPERWKAMIAVSGGGEDAWIPQLTKVPIWAFHAADDQLVPPSRSSDLVAGINAAGGRAYVSIVPTGGHNIGAQVLARDEIFQWMEHPEQTPVTEIDWSKRSAIADMTDEVRFVPGADVSSAARVRVNRDLLESLSYVLAEQVPPDALQGWKPGRSEVQQSGLARINVHVGGMHYNAELENAWIAPHPNGQLRVHLGLRRMTMTITGTQLQGRLLSAQAGPMAIYIGHAEPVWLVVDVTPQVVERQLKLQLNAVDFQIPAHNWSISRPGVDVRGLPFMADRIADRLVDGIAEKKWMIEQEIRNSVPQMLAQLETRVAQFWSRTMTYRQFPMPLWQPKFRFYPESVVVDDQGLELRMGALVAALAPKSDNLPIRKYEAPSNGFPVASTTGLDVAASVRIADAYSDLLTASDVAGFHVLDMNGEGFRRLGRHEFWNSVLPAERQIPPTTELNTEFVVAQAFRVVPVPEEGRAGLHRNFVLRIPQLQLRLATREPEQKEWTDLAVADIGFDQPLRLDLQKPNFSTRYLEVGFGKITPPQVEARFVAGDPSDKIDAARIGEAFYDGWTANIGRSDRDGRLRDIQQGGFTLRWDALGMTDDHFVLQLKRPGIRVYNRSDSAVEYQMRGTTSPWSELLRLEPGKFHEFQPATALTWRSQGEQGEQLYTLPLGFEAQIRNGTAAGGIQLFQLGDTATPAAETPAGEQSAATP